MSAAPRHDARRIVALLCRTSDPGPEGAEGTRELAELLDGRTIGSFTDSGARRYEDDLREARGCLLEAGGQIDDALHAGEVPILLAAECTVALGTLPVVIRHRPEARVLWLDAHADFNTPASTTSGHLGGRSLAGACGLWATGFAGVLDPARVVMHGVRDVEALERVALDRLGVHLATDATQLAGLAVFVHVDLDVLDPDVLPSRLPAPGGLTPDGLRSFLARVAASCDIVGAQITSHVPGHAGMVADAIAPLLRG